MPTTSGVINSTHSNISQNNPGTREVSNAGPLNMDAWLRQELGSDLTLSVTDALASVQNAVIEIKSQLKNKSPDANERKWLAELLTKASNSLSKLKSLQNDHKDQLPLELAQSVNDVELALNSNAKTESSDLDQNSQKDSDAAHENNSNSKL